jgi:hypothetical protein
MAKKNYYEIRSGGNRAIRGFFVTLSPDGADYQAASHQGFVPTDIYVRRIDSGSEWSEKCIVPANTDVETKIIPFATEDIARRTAQSITTEAEKIRARNHRQISK